MGPARGGRRQRKPRPAPTPYTNVPASTPQVSKTVELEPVIIVPDTVPQEARDKLRPSIFYARAAVLPPKISIRNYRPSWML